MSCVYRVKLNVRIHRRLTFHSKSQRTNTHLHPTCKHTHNVSALNVDLR